MTMQALLLLIEAILVREGRDEELLMIAEAVVARCDQIEKEAKAHEAARVLHCDKEEAPPGEDGASRVPNLGEEP